MILRQETYWFVLRIKQEIRKGNDSQMKFYDITYIIDDETNARLSKLAERYEKIKGWNEKETLQFAVAATSKSDIEAKLDFLEEQILPLEEECQTEGRKSRAENSVYQ